MNSRPGRLDRSQFTRAQCNIPGAPGTESCRDRHMGPTASLLIPLWKATSTLGQRNELFLVAWHDIELAGPPFLLGFLDALLGGGHEVPPDVTLRAEGRTPKQHEMTALVSPRQRDGIARPEDKELVRREAVTGHCQG